MEIKLLTIEDLDIHKKSPNYYFMSNISDKHYSVRGVHYWWYLLVLNLGLGFLTASGFEVKLKDKIGG